MNDVPAWVASLDLEDPKPYETKAWVSQVITEEEEVEEEEPLPWWETLTGPEAKPYETKAWVIIETQEEEDLPCDLPTAGDLDDLTCQAEDAWWESLGGEGPKPYEYATWTFLTSDDSILEFIIVSESLFSVFDETYFDRTSEGVVLDSGYFNSIREELYDSAYYLGDERGILMARTLSKMMIYDSRASSPGRYGQILQPLGILCIDPNPAGGYAIITEPVVGPVTEVVTDEGGIAGPVINTDGSSTELTEITCDGEFAGAALEMVRLSNPNDDCPPGTLLGTLSYETFNDVITITDWEHYNWEDDTPVLKAVQTLLARLPETITEVRVENEPTAFWTSLGFKTDFKGDPFIHFRAS